MQRQLPTSEIHPELGLPIYNESVPLYSRLDRLGKIQGETALRRTALRVRADDFSSLVEALEIADTVFSDTAQAIGADVVPHAWGLALRDVDYPESHLLHPSYQLVAEVALIRRVRLPGWRQQFRMERELAAYQTDNPHLPHWTDADPLQFGYGMAPGDSQRRLWLLDIEPRIERPAPVATY